jgi:hypothetical protein
MPERITQTSVTFLHPFTLGGDDAEYPAGTYTLQTTQEPIEGLSVIAYRRVSTTIEVVSRRDGHASRQLVTIEPSELAAARHRDAQANAQLPAPSLATTLASTGANTGDATAHKSPFTGKVSLAAAKRTQLP